MRVDKSKWQRRSFYQLGNSQLGKTLDSKKNKGKPYPYLCAFNIGYGSFNLSSVKEILLEDDELERYLVKKGDLLICEGGDTGRCAIWDSDEPIYYQNALHRVRFNFDVFNKFVMYVMHYYKQTGIIDVLSHGQTIKHLTQKGLSRLYLSIPTFDEQQTIAAELDAIQAIIDGYKAQIADLDTLAQSIFLDMFGDPITNQKEWEINSFSKLFTLKSGDGLSAKQFVVGDFPVYGGNGIVGFHNLCNKSGEYIIVGRVGAKCGNVRLVKGKFWLTDNAFELTQKHTPFNNVFLVALLSLLNLGSKAKAMAQPVISNASLKDVQVILPPFALQQHFAGQVEANEKQKELIRQQLADAETLMKERMQYYFS